MPEPHKGHASGVHSPRSSDTSVKNGTSYCLAMDEAASPSVSRLAKPASSMPQSSKSTRVERKAKPVLSASSTSKTRRQDKGAGSDAGIRYYSENGRVTRPLP